MDEMMSNVSSQIQRAINEAINTQVLPQIRNVMMAGSGHVTKRGWDVPVERPETNTEVQRSLNAESDPRNEQGEDQQVGEFLNRNVHDSAEKKRQKIKRKKTFGLASTFGSTKNLWFSARIEPTISGFSEN